MKPSEDSVIRLCQDRYESILSDLELKNGATEFVSRFGEISQDYVNQVSQEIEERMLEDGDRKAVVKRMFSIIVEGLQNVRLHGEKNTDGSQTCFFLILRNAESYFIYLGNLVFNKNISDLQRRIDQVNALGKAEIKELYLDVLTNGVISSKGGAGLGYITMSMKSQNELVGNYIEVDNELSHYDLEVKLDRIKKDK